MPKAVAPHRGYLAEIKMQQKLGLWTRAGLIELGQLIKACRKSKKLSQEKAAVLIQKVTGIAIGARTLSSIEISAGMPEYNTLAVIAASGLVEKDGKVLNMQDFVAIASETYTSNKNCLAELIENYLNIHDITLEEFSSICGVTTDDLRAICQGIKTADYEGDLILLSGHLYNPDTKLNFNHYPEMMEYCLRRNSGQKECHTDTKPKLLY